MPVGNMIRIGSDVIDVAQPCDVVAALKKMQLKLVSGGQRQTVRIDGEEVTFYRSSDESLTKLIRQYEAECARVSGGKAKRSRYARRVRFTS